MENCVKMKTSQLHVNPNVMGNRNVDNNSKQDFKNYLKS